MPNAVVPSSVITLFYKLVVLINRFLTGSNGLDAMRNVRGHLTPPPMLPLPLLLTSPHACPP